MEICDAAVRELFRENTRHGDSRYTCVRARPSLASERFLRGDRRPGTMERIVSIICLLFLRPANQERERDNFNSECAANEEYRRISWRISLLEET